MKKLFRVLAILTCFALLVTLVPEDLPKAYARENIEEQSSVEESGSDAQTQASSEPKESAPSDEQSGDSDLTPPPSGGESSSEPSSEPSEEPSAAPGEEPTAEPSSEPTAEPSTEPSVEPSDEAPVDEPTEEDIIDYADKASRSPAFVRGFAEVLSDDTEVYEGNAASDEVIAWIGEGVVYVLSRTPENSSRPDRLQIAFNVDPDADIQIGWIDANDARPMNPEEGGEVDRYRESCVKVDSVRCYADDDDFPLCVIPCRYPEATVAADQTSANEPVAYDLPVEPVTVAMSQTSATIGVGDKGVTLGVLFSDGKTINVDGSTRAVKFTSSATKYVTVDASTGRLTGVRTGSATITATTEFGSVTCKVTVKSAPSTISATPTSAEILIGGNTKIAPKFASSSYGGSCTFQSSDPSIATVAADGTVTGVSRGQVTIYVYAYNLPSKPAKATVRVYGPATEVDIPEDSFALCAGMERQLSVVLPEFDREECVFTSSDETVASVTASGLVHANALGSATITATSVITGVSDSCTLEVLPAPAEENLVLSASSYKLGLNESFNVLSLIEITGDCHAEFKFKSSNTSYVKVDAAGKVTGVRAGSATITITTHNGLVRTVKVTVYKNPTSVSFSSKTMALGVGMSASTKISFNSTSAYSQYRFTSSDEAVASIDPVSGVVTAHSAGTAVLTCVPQKGKSGTCTVTVLPAPETISAQQEEIVLGLGEGGGKVAGVYPEGTLCSFTYASNDESVLTVNATTGAITTVGMGSADVVITAHNGVTTTCRVEVKEAPTTLTLSYTSMKLMVGETNGLLTGTVNEGAASGITLSSSNTGYVKIVDGKLVGVKAGTVTITAKTYNGVKATCKVTVYAKPTTVAFSSKTMKLGAGDSGKVTVKFNSTSAYSPCTFESSDPEIATIDPNTGVVTAHQVGSATLKVTTLNGKSGTCTVTVLPAPETIGAQREEIVLGLGEGGGKVAGVYPEGTLCSFTYASNDESVLTVNATTGAITTVGTGSTDVVITAHNGVTATCRVEVKEAPTTLTLSYTSMKLMVGETNGLLTGTVNESAASGITLSSSNTRYVKIVDGKLVGVKAGTVTITAKTYNGVKATCKVTVYAKPTTVAFSSKTMKLGAGDSGKVTVKFNSTSAYSPCTFESSDPEIATIDPNTGVVTAHQVGSATLKVTTLNGKSGTCSVTVLPAPETISAQQEEIVLGLGEGGGKVAGVYPEGTLCSFTYASNDVSVLTVNATTGAITTVGTGITDVVITAHNGVTATCRVEVKEAPTTLTLSYTSMKLMVGETNGLLTGTVNEGAASGITLSSSNTRYVKIVDGKLVGVKAGTVTITAKTYNGVKATCKVTVYAKPTTVAFSSKTMKLGAGDSGKVTVKFNSTSAYSPCTFESSDPEIATIDPNTGVVTAHQVGSATLKVTTLNGKSGTCTVTVLPAPETISAQQEEIVLGLGEGGGKVAGVYPEGTLCSFTYASNDESVLTVNATTGAITTVGMGSTDVVITAHNGVTATCRVEVKEAPTTLTLSYTSMKLMVGETNGLLTGTVNEGAASGITLSSSNTRYVKIVDGKLVGVTVGTVTITAKTYNGVKATCKVTVCAAPKSVSFKTKSLLIGCGEYISTAVVYNPTSAYSMCSYTSSDPSVATVDPVTGVVLGVAPGFAVITAKPQKGTAGTCTVEVRPAPDSLALSQTSLALAEGMSATLTPLLPEGTAGHGTFESSNPEVASVTAGGVVKGVGGGTAIITATTYNGHSASCTVTVTPAPVRLSYDFTKITMLKGDRIQIPEPIAYDVNGNVCPSTYTFTSSSTRYATVSGGTVKGVKTGTITITAKSYNGKTASFKLTIVDSVSGLTLAPSAAVLYTNGTDYVDELQLTATLTGGVLATVQYASSNPDVATVDQDGLVTPVSAGTAVISVRTIDGKLATADVTVKQLSSNIALDCTELVLGEGESHQLYPQLDPNTEAVITYTTSDNKVATVDNDGLIRAISGGTATVSASMQDGKHADVVVTVLPGPTGIRLNTAGVHLALGEGIQLIAELSANSENYCDKVSFVSADATVATIDETGALVAVGEGETTVTATTCNGLTASCRVRVSATVESGTIAFEKANYSIVCGDSDVLPLLLTRDIIERGYTVTSSDPELLTVDGLRVTANSERTGEVTVTLTVNPLKEDADADPEEGGLNTSDAGSEGIEGQNTEGATAEPLQASCIVRVCEFAEISFEPEEVTMETNSETTLAYEILPENLIGVCYFEVEDPELISFDPETGVIASNTEIGTTNIVFHSFNNSAMSCPVTVEGQAKYRALVVGSYYNSGASTDLPFIGNDMSIVSTALSKSVVEDERYSITRSSNPSKSALKSLVTGTFKDATANDVSVIYIVTHGYYQATSNGYYGYYFSLAPNYSKDNPNTYVTSGELMSWMSGIPGNVVLVLVSCKSGGFIVDCSGSINAAGNISVLTAQTFDQNASFYHGKTESTTVEFLTYSLGRGLGYDQMNGALPSMLADRNGDGQVSVAEAFSYAASDCEFQVGLKRSTFKETTSSTWLSATSCIKVPSIYKKSAFDNWYQSPQYTLAPGASELVLSAW